VSSFEDFGKVSLANWMIEINEIILNNLLIDDWILKSGVFVGIIVH